MRTASTAVLAGIVGIAVGAGGWALIGPDKTVHDKPAAAVSSATPSPGHTVSGAQYATAQAIADKLTAAGFTVSTPRKSDVDPSLGIDKSYDLTITQKPGPAPGDSGINLFRNGKAVTTWTGMSQALGGIAVVGDTWAVSLTTDTAAGVQSSKALAPAIAKALGGTVVE